MNISYQELEEAVRDLVETQKRPADLTVPILQSQRKVFNNNVEVKDLSPEIIVPPDYAQWAVSRPVEQILEGDETGKRKKKQNRSRPRRNGTH